MAQSEARPSLGEITRERPAIDLRFEGATVQRLIDGVLLQFYRGDDGQMYQVTFKPNESFCTDIDRLLEVIKIAVSQQDPDIRFNMEQEIDGVQLHLLVTTRSVLGIEIERSVTARVSVVDAERSMGQWWKEVRALREETAALKSRLELLETTSVVFAIGPKPQSEHGVTTLVCNTLRVPIMDNASYFGDVMDNVRAKTVHLVQHVLFRNFYGHLERFSVEGHAVFRNKHASRLLLEVTPECVSGGYDGRGADKCWTWVREVLGNFPNCKVVYITVAGSHPPASVITEFVHVKFVFRAKWREGCPEPWRCIARRNNKNVSVEYFGKG